MTHHRVDAQMDVYGMKGSEEADGWTIDKGWTVKCDTATPAGGKLNYGESGSNKSEELCFVIKSFNIEQTKTKAQVSLNCC